MPPSFAAASTRAKWSGMFAWVSERVHHVAQRGAGRRLLGKVARAAAAQDQHVDVADVRREVFHRKRPARPRWRAARFAGSRPGGTAPQAPCRRSADTPVPRPCPSCRIPRCRCAFASCPAPCFPSVSVSLAFGFHDGQKGAPRPARNEKSTNRASPAKAARRRRRPTGRRTPAAAGGRAPPAVHAPCRGPASPACGLIFPARAARARCWAASGGASCRWCPRLGT